MKPNNVIAIPSNKDNVFRYWFTLLTPFHNLSPREADVAAGFVKYKYLLGLKISDEKLLEEVLMSNDTKRKIRDEAGVSDQHFQVIMGVLRKKGVFVNGKINRRYIPNIDKNSKTFSLAFFFNLEDAEKNNKEGK